MGYYFEDHLSMYAATGWQVKQTLNAIVKRYVGNNPPHPMTYRAYSKRGIRRGKDYRYQADFAQVFPEAKAEQYVYAWAKYWSDGAAAFMADVSCLGPMVVYLNGQIIFKSDLFTERYGDKRHRINLPLAAGWNHFVLRFKKTRGGFGGVFGTWLGKHPYYFVMPTPEREGGGGAGGQEGWIFTEPMDKELAVLPGPGVSEASSGLKWLPERNWGEAEAGKGQLERIFGLVPGAYAVGWTTGMFLLKGKGTYRLRGSHAGNIVVTIGDKEVFSAVGSGKINVEIVVSYGRHDVMVRSICPKRGGWGYALEMAEEEMGVMGKPVALASSCAIVGTDDPWIYIGPFEAAGGGGRR